MFKNGKLGGNKILGWILFYRFHVLKAWKENLLAKIKGMLCDDDYMT